MVLNWNYDKGGWGRGLGAFRGSPWRISASKFDAPKIEKWIFPANPRDQTSVIGGAKLDYPGVGEGGSVADCAKKPK